MLKIVPLLLLRDSLLYVLSKFGWEISTWVNFLNNWNPLHSNAKFSFNRKECMAFGFLASDLQRSSNKGCYRCFSSLALHWRSTDRGITKEVPKRHMTLTTYNFLLSIATSHNCLWIKQALICSFILGKGIEGWFQLSSMGKYGL